MMTKNSQLTKALLQHAQNQPERVALRGDSLRLTYAELDQAIVQWAQHLIERDARVVLLDMDNDPLWVVAHLALARAGLTCVPVPGFFSEAQRAHIKGITSADHVFTLAAAPEKETNILKLERLHSPNAEIAGQLITFTSGSTGDPKGAVLSYEQLESVAVSLVRALADLDIQKHLSLLPLSTLLENLAGIYAPLIKGIEVVIPSGEITGMQGSSGLDAMQLAACLNQERPDSVILVPQLLTALVTLSEFGLLNDQRLKMVAVGGGKVAQSLLERAVGLGIPVFEGYGLTECASVVAMNLPNAARLGSVGKPLAHAKIKIIEGEICVAESMMSGYLVDKAMARDALVAALPEENIALHDGVPFWKTGDLGDFDQEGFLYVFGRKRNVFITSYGRNVNPEWPEALLTEHPEIAQAVVYGEALEQVHADLWVRTGFSRESAEARLVAVNSVLPDYAQLGCVNWYDESFPAEYLSPAGKVRREQYLKGLGSQRTRATFEMEKRA